MSLARVWMLLLLLPLAWWWWIGRRHRDTVATGDFRVAAHTAHHLWWAQVTPILRMLGIALLVIAASGPLFGGRERTLRKNGIAIVIAIDVSSSMLAEDFAPSNRLEVAKRQAISFIRGRDADRIGLVAFAGEALTQVPVTLDYLVLEQAVTNLRVGVLEDGTAIGSGLATAVNRLRRVPGPSRVVLLLTDGENNRGSVDPRTAAATAESFGVRIYTVGVGTEGEARIPTGRGLSGYRYEVLPVRIDEELLTEIAEQTGGQYFRAKDSESLGRIFRQIDALERAPVDVVQYASREETTRPFLLAALVFLGLELVVSATRVVRVP